jgi:hypothetical protein
MKVVAANRTSVNPRDLLSGVQSGAYWVSGPSSEMSAVARELLDRVQHVAYFLVAGWPESRVPCFRPFDRSITRRPPRATDVLDLSRGVPSGEQAFDSFERGVLADSSGATTVVIECITPASDEESAFVRAALTSRLARHRPVIVLTHDRTSDTVATDTTARQTLAALFLGGGRIRATDWDAADDARNLVDRRVVDGETWYTYASRQVANTARGAAEGTLLRGIAGQPWYPVLRSASRADTLGELLEAYSPEALAVTLADDPRGAARYFDRLRRVSANAGNREMEQIAASNYVAIASSVRPVLASRAVERLSSLESDHASRQWFALGQSLARESNVKAQLLAVEAFQRSREAASSDPALQHARVSSRLAAAANGEALVAYKHRQVHRARYLEESALRALAAAGDSDELTTQRVLLNSHLGDIYLRGLNDPESALVAYRLAFEQALISPSDDELRYVAPRLAAALLAVGLPTEAAQALDQLIARFRQRTSDRVLLKAHLTLAEAHLRSGHERRAAACYWSLVRSRRLAPAAARGVAANLRLCHPRLSARAERRLERILVEHEAAAMLASRVLAALHRVPSRILEAEAA